ncbi:hypothetical protein B0A49_12818 [Cryomyces minteri]|uniref:5'-3' DNA helicase ZGRF1-like N-terminal domain-containing protein n=1 Tax=Cryomyces minteri TaxID=331657 RepID=A0A4U0WHZ2_9PEZI|nr:hypothetical protein B0A49_12818 [Cryomyces minteri]
MTSALSRRAPALAVPPTQNTAPVLEFNCLYTHDIRRKQKRWQDGFLRYHTFNRRVMVYDVPRNFIGDMHWQREGDLQQGDEVALEKGGVMVQVAEAVGTTETDLSELLHKRNKVSSPSRRVPSPASVRRTPASKSTAPLAPSQLRHKSLNALLGTPKGRVGTAVLSTKSPFELNHAGPENDWEQGRSAKRQKTADTGAAWNITETLETSEGPPRAGTRVTEPNGRATVVLPSAKRRSLPKQTVKESVTLPSETDDIPSDITAIESSANGSPAFERPERAEPILLVSSSPPPMRSVSFRKQKPTTDGPVSEALKNDLDKTASSVLRDPSRMTNKVAKSADGAAVSPRTANAASRRDIEARAITVKPCPPRRMSPPTVPASPPRTTSVATGPSPRPFRRVVSENDRPPPAADDYDTSTIDDRLSLTISGPISFAGKPLPRPKTAARPATAIGAASASTRQPARLKRPFQRSQSLVTPALESIGRAEPAKEKDPDLGPWSREAFDLFDWRPPDRDREGRKIAVGGNNGEG